MNQKRSMDEALSAAKKMRREIAGTQEGKSSPQEKRLSVVPSSPEPEPTTQTEAAPEGKSTDTPRATERPVERAPVIEPSIQRPVWVRHTVGLRDATSLRLKDAADSQKRKLRHGTLKPGEPANEQEIADLGVNLALKQLGYIG